MTQTTLDFDGETYQAERDRDRLRRQLRRVEQALNDHGWHTLQAVATLTGDPEASVSARMRDLRKTRFGGHVVERRYLHDGLWEYRLADKASA